MECDGTTSLWLQVRRGSSRRPRSAREGDPWPVDQSVRPRSQSYVVPQHSIKMLLLFRSIDVLTGLFIKARGCAAQATLGSLESRKTYLDEVADGMEVIT